METLKRNEKSILFDVISVFKTKLFVLLLSFISIVILARGLGADGRGALAAILVYPQLALALTEGGMRQAAINFIGNRKAGESEILGALVAYIIGAGALGYISVTMLIYFTGSENFQLPLILAACSLLPLNLMVNAFQGILLGKQNISNYNKVIWVQKLLYVLALIILYYFNKLTVLSVTLVMSMAALYNAIQIFLYIRNEHDRHLKFDLSVLISMLKVGVIYAFAFFLIQANYKLDILLLAWLSDNNNVGEYAVSIQIGELLWQLPSAVLVVLISKSANSTDEDLISTLCKTVRLTFFITLLLFILLLPGCYFLIVPFFGVDFGGVFDILLLLGPGLIFATLFKTINAYYAGKGRPAVAVYVMSFSVSINILLNLFLIPNYGSEGAAIASTVSYVISGFFIVKFFSVDKGVSIKEVVFVKRADLSKLRRR